MANTQIKINDQNREIVFQSLSTSPAQISDNGAKPLRVAGTIIESIRTFGNQVQPEAIEVAPVIEGGFNNAEVLASTPEVPAVNNFFNNPTPETIPEVVNAIPEVTPSVVEQPQVAVPDIFGMNPAPVVMPVAEPLQVQTAPVVEPLQVVEPLVTPNLEPVAQPMVASEPTLEPVTFNVHKIEEPALEKALENKVPTQTIESIANSFLVTFADLLSKIAEMEQTVNNQQEMIETLRTQQAVSEIKTEMTPPMVEPVQLFEQPGMARQLTPMSMN